MNIIMRLGATLLAASTLPSGVVAEPGGAKGRAIPFLPIPDEPPPRLEVDQPLAGPLADRGVAIIPYRTENFRILPVFGPTAADVSPRAGHLHVSVDDLPWRWADVGNSDAIVLVGLAPGQHKVLVELATPVHKILARKTVTFTVPKAGHHPR